MVRQAGPPQTASEAMAYLEVLRDHRDNVAWYSRQDIDSVEDRRRAAEMASMIAADQARR